jgi:hypothetical protein
MLKHGWCVPFAAAVVLISMVAGCGEDPAPVYDLAAINFETTSVPAGGAGQLYNTVIQFTTSGGAAPPDQFEINVGVLPKGVELSRDREDNDFDGLPDEDGAYTGHARLLGFPRESGTYTFQLKAISTGELAGLAQTGDLPALADRLRLHDQRRGRLDHHPLADGGGGDDGPGGAGVPGSGGLRQPGEPAFLS